MKTKKITGLRKMSSGRGPLCGRVYVLFGTQIIPCRIVVGASDGGNVIMIGRSRSPCVGWTKNVKCPIVAETISACVEALCKITDEQLDSLGFVESRADVSGN